MSIRSKLVAFAALATVPAGTWMLAAPPSVGAEPLPPHLWELHLTVTYVVVDDDFGSADTTRITTQHTIIDEGEFHLKPVTWDPNLCAGEEVRADSHIRAGVDEANHRAVVRVDLELFEGSSCTTIESEGSTVGLIEVPLGRAETTGSRVVGTGDVQLCRGGCPHTFPLGDEVDSVTVLVEVAVRKVGVSPAGWWRYQGRLGVEVIDLESLGADEVTTADAGYSFLIPAVPVLPRHEYTVIRTPELEAAVCAGDEAQARVTSDWDSTALRLSQGDSCTDRYRRARVAGTYDVAAELHWLFPRGFIDTRRVPSDIGVIRSESTHVTYSNRLVDDVVARARVTDVLQEMIPIPGIAKDGSRPQWVESPWTGKQDGPPVVLDGVLNEIPPAVDLSAEVIDVDLSGIAG